MRHTKLDSSGRPLAGLLCHIVSHEVTATLNLRDSQLDVPVSLFHVGLRTIVTRTELDFGICPCQSVREFVDRS